MEEKIVNKVSESGIITLDLSVFLPEETIEVFDVKEFLFAGIILKEKEFREALKSVNWSAYKNKEVAVFCSADAIIPVWAYMLVVAYLQPQAKEIFLGTQNEMRATLILKNISKINIQEFENKRVVLKGCGDKKVDNIAYVEATKILLPVVKSIMYGEPCSTVPVYKRS